MSKRPKISKELYKRELEKKQNLNTPSGKKVINSDNACIAAKIADRAIQQTIDADELENRMQGLFEPEVIEMACNIVNDFFLKSEEHNFFEAWLMNDKMSIWELSRLRKA